MCAFGVLEALALRVGYAEMLVPLALVLVLCCLLHLAVILEWGKRLSRS